jgi:hypothetical protein
MYTTPTTRIIKSLCLTVALLCLTVLFQMPARADTLTIIGSSNSQNPLIGSSGQIGFLGQAFNNNFNVTALGQTFDFVFGQYQIGPGGVGGDSGCLDGPCMAITLTGSLTTPIGALSFSGSYEESEGAGRALTVDWLTGSGPFTFSTPEGGTVVFTMELLDFFGNNPSAIVLLFDQSARVTITGFQPGGQTAVPEPASMLMLGTGLAGLFAARRRRKRS